MHQHGAPQDDEVTIFRSGRTDEDRDDSLTQSERSGSIPQPDAFRRASLPRESQRGSVLMARPSNVFNPMPSSPSRFSGRQSTYVHHHQFSMHDDGSTSTEDMDTLNPSKEKMKLVNIATLERPEAQRDYRGQLRRWPGMLLLGVVVATAVVAISLGARQSYNASLQRRQDVLVREQRRRAIQDGLVDDSVLVDADGKVGNPMTYDSTGRKCQLPDYQSKNGRVYAVAANGTEVTVAIKGTNWFGMETGHAIPFGLWENDQNGTTVYEVAAFLHRHKFNSIRLPLCAQSILKNTAPDKRLINLDTNRAINIKGYMELLKSVLKALAYRDITVLLSMHTLTTKGATGSWFNADVSEDDFLKAIDMLTSELCSDEYWNVIGIDLKNEPNDCGWGPLDKASAKCDWVAGAKLIGDRMHAGCKNWLAFVEGSASMGHTVGKITYFDWWGGRLQDADTVPVTLKTQDKLVWSPHYYSTAVAPQPYFYDNVVGAADGRGYASYTELPDDTLKTNIHITMEHMFGYLREKRKYAIVVGEFGGLYTKDEHPQYTIRRTVDFTIQEMMLDGYSGGYMWCINPESAYDFPSAGRKAFTSEGLLLDDWLTPNKLFMEAMAKMNALPNLRPFPCFAPEKKKP
ncbi:hypothetical protein DYB30_004698 [Aphanomyces astaci]|uniref:Glycoside hydrolase family 5 domain-containing protein n=1 Tax=Aphanomyces astaci TaxID=112090 RepID=A0A397DPI0_APHAT|nr:hypothetical protein DYB36_000257 [Aphanomyces astaci]RHY65806.1 hypothetical protein DYB30_004698 [Aphanomyces astaci]